MSQFSVDFNPKIREKEKQAAGHGSIFDTQKVINIILIPMSQYLIHKLLNSFSSHYITVVYRTIPFLGHQLGSLASHAALLGDQESLVPSVQTLKGALSRPGLREFQGCCDPIARDAEGPYEIRPGCCDDGDDDDDDDHTEDNDNDGDDDHQCYCVCYYFKSVGVGVVVVVVVVVIIVVVAVVVVLVFVLVFVLVLVVVVVVVVVSCMLYVVFCMLYVVCCCCMLYVVCCLLLFCCCFVVVAVAAVVVVSSYCCV